MSRPRSRFGWSCAAVAVAVAAALLPELFAADKAVVPLPNAHAHNDYEHNHPLTDALDHGFCSIEADIFLVNGELRVGHTAADLRPDRTLESLYLNPLRERARTYGGKVYPGGPTIYLLVDVKTKAEPTYTALHDVFSHYADLLSVTDHGRFEPKAVTVVISGNVAREMITAQPRRFAGIDGRKEDLNSDVPAHLMPWISENWTKQDFAWKGDGKMPDEARAKLRDFVAKAHRHGRRVRFWNTPESTAVWEELRAAGVDLINTDKLDELKEFLLHAAPAKRER